MILTASFTVVDSLTIPLCSIDSSMVRESTLTSTKCVLDGFHWPPPEQSLHCPQRGAWVSLSSEQSPLGCATLHTWYASLVDVPAPLSLWKYCPTIYFHNTSRILLWAQKGISSGLPMNGTGWMSVASESSSDKVSSTGDRMTSTLSILPTYNRKLPSVVESR